MKRLLATLSLSLLAGALCMAPALAGTSADPTGSTGSSAISRDVIRGSFTQRKYLAEIKQPLVSTGHYVIIAKRGLLWQIDKPVKAQLVISKKHLIQRSDGQETMRIDADRQPALHIVAAVLLAVFRGDTERLQQYFDIHQEDSSSDGRTLTLQPRSSAVARFIGHIRVRGAPDINHIEVYQPDGDKTVIDLHEKADTPNRPTAAERAAFQQ